MISEIVELYFRFCHRQPLWLFEREELSSPDFLVEELTFALLALTMRFSTTTYFENRAHKGLSQRYGEVARGHIMFRIAQGTVQMSTIQSLCLLAFANFTGKYNTSARYRNIASLTRPVVANSQQTGRPIWHGSISTWQCR